ncbi:hypothetical protein [Helicobacter sp. T3_23-1056]
MNHLNLCHWKKSQAKCRKSQRKTQVKSWGKNANFGVKTLASQYDKIAVIVIFLDFAKSKMRGNLFY